MDAIYLNQHMERIKTCRVYTSFVFSRINHRYVKLHSFLNRKRIYAATLVLVLGRKTVTFTNKLLFHMKTNDSLLFFFWASNNSLLLLAWNVMCSCRHLPIWTRACTHTFYSYEHIRKFEITSTGQQLSLWAQKKIKTGPTDYKTDKVTIKCLVVDRHIA